MRRPKTFIICCVILLAIVASGIIIPQVKREKAQKELKEQHEAELEILAAYPWIDEIDPDNIAKLTTCEGDIVYTVTDKEAIAEIMGIIRDTNPQPVIINPEDDKGRPAGGPKNALWLDITTKDDKESWSLTIDDENFPTDFVIDHTVYKNKDTNWFETKTGYFTKPDKIYRKVKAIMYKGERTDLNEVSDAGQHGSSEWNRVDFEYNPDAIFTAEPLTLTDKEGLYTTDVKYAYGKYFFTRIKIDEDLVLSEISYEDELRFKYFWGYMDENGDNEAEFALKSTDPEKPYCGIHKMLGVTEDRVYAMTFHADENDYFSDKIYYLTAFDMSGNVVAEKQYPYKIDFYPEVQSLITKSGDILVYNGATALFDEEFNEIALNTDHRIIMVAPTENDEIAVLLKKEKGYNRAILDDKDLSIVSEDDRSYDLSDYRIVEMPDQSTLIMVKYESEGCRSKLVELTIDGGYETDIIDTFHSGIKGWEILDIVSRTRDKIICKTEDSQSYVGEVKLTIFTEVDRDVASKRKRIKVFGNEESLIDFNAYSTDYYAEECFKADGSTDSWVESDSELRDICRQDNKPDVIYIYHAEPEFVRLEEAADLSALLTEDEDLSEEDFFPGLIKAFTYNGVLRAIPVSTSFYTVAAPSGLLKEGVITAEAISEYISDNPERKLFYNYKRGLLDEIITYPGNPFYNPDEGICNFESEEFKTLLKSIRNLDREYCEDRDNYHGDDYNPEKEYQKWIETIEAAGAVLDSTGDSAAFYEINEFNYIFGDKYDLVGFSPSDGSRGCFASPDVFVINGLSKEKEGALEYIKYVLDNRHMHNYPARIKDYDADADYLVPLYAHGIKSSSQKLFIRKMKDAFMSARGCCYSLPEEASLFIDDTLAYYCGGRADEDETAGAFQKFFEQPVK